MSRSDSVLVTGAAGFIGFHLAKRLLDRGDPVVGVDSLSDYYDVGLKEARIQELMKHPCFRFVRMDLTEAHAVSELFRTERFSHVAHLAAQPGVRYSLQNPRAYIDSNLVGFVNILEACRETPPAHLVYASSSSVYGANTAMPFSVHHNVDHPLSLYAATKKANELLAHTYSHLFRLPTTGLRFFTVYGPWGRPDMGYFLFTKAILEGRPIDVYNGGDMERDFTYVDDIVEGVVRVMEHPPVPDPDWSSAAPDPASSNAPYRVYNIGNNKPVKLLYLISLIEQELGRTATKRLLPMQPGDVTATFADVDDLMRDVGFAPTTSIEVGIQRFVRWYRDYYAV
ncbi:MAG TPA: NAD-dependent epimerase [Gemmatimonadaceae bacterium]|jgi:UDP-glucuronate 4-epimerase